MRKSILLSVILLLAVIIPASAVTRLVPDEYLTIQAAIEDSNNGDIVIVSPGTYVENIDFLGKNITVTGTEPENWDVVENTIIDGNNTSSVVTFKNNESNEAVLTGFTITGGYGSIDLEFDEEIIWGAGIFCKNSSPFITNNIITGNHGPVDPESDHANFGAGISCHCFVEITQHAIIINYISEIFAFMDAIYSGNGLQQ